MLDVRLFRNDPDAVRAGLARRGEDPGAVDEVVRLDAELRNLTARRDGLRAEIRTLSNEVGKLFRDKRQDEAAELQEQSRILGAEEKALDVGADEMAAELREKLLRIPNLPSPDAPDGLGEDDNVVVRVEGFDADRYADHQRVLTHNPIAIHAQSVQ